MMRDRRWAVPLVLLVVSGCGATPLGRAKHAAYAAKQLAEASYTAVRRAHRAGEADDALMAKAAKYYDRYYAAASALHRAIARAEAAGDERLASNEHRRAIAAAASGASRAAAALSEVKEALSHNLNAER